MKSGSEGKMRQKMAEMVRNNDRCGSITGNICQIWRFGSVRQCEPISVRGNMAEGLHMEGVIITRVQIRLARGSYYSRGVCGSACGKSEGWPPSHSSLLHNPSSTVATSCSLCPTSFTSFAYPILGITGVARVVEA